MFKKTGGVTDSILKARLAVYVMQKDREARSWNNRIEVLEAKFGLAYVEENMAKLMEEAKGV